MKKSIDNRIAELEGAHAHTQELTRQVLETVRRLERARELDPQSSAFWHLVKITDDGVLFASWIKPRRLRWTARRERSTTFSQQQSAYAALQGIKPRKGETYELMRILP